MDVSGSTSLSGTGVTFYNTQSAGHSYGKISFSGSSSISLTAPTSGSWEAMLLVDDRSAPNNNTLSMTGSSTLLLEGVVYFPNQPVKITGSSGAAYTILICDTLDVSGSSTVGADYSSLAHGNPISGSGGKVKLGE